MRWEWSRLRVFGALLLLSSVVNLVWLVVSDSDAERVRLGLAGALAVVLVWSSAARTAPRAAGRSSSGVVVLLLAVALTLVVYLFDLTAADDESLLEWLGLTHRGDGLGDTGYFIEIEPSTAVAWGVGLVGVAVTALLGPVCRAVRNGPSPRVVDARGVLLAAPFGFLAAGALGDGAQVEALIAAVSAVWLLASLRALGAADAGASTRPA